ncbi:MAG: FecR domain-containing protein [Pseudomonadota bacterium]
MFRAVFTSLALCLLTVAPALAEEVIGEIKLARGEASIERGGETLSAATGMQIEKLDILRTGSDGALGLVFTDTSRVSLGPDSEMKVETYVFRGQGAEGNTFDSRLTKGSLAAASGLIGKTPNAMRVLMPTTILGVRGTEFAVQVEE